MNKEIDKHKIKYSIAVVLYSSIGSYYFQPFIHGNNEAINVIVTVFSILAGFLVAVITIIGDPSSLPKGGWQRAQLGSEIITNRLTRHKWLFTIYLITLFIIFISMLIKGKYPILATWVERIYLFFAICAFTMSFRLPSVLMALHQERIEQEIKSRREDEGITE
jgi:hypothetical protein